MTVDARLANRLKTAAGLWEKYTDSVAPRQLDKWLAEAMRAEKRFGSQDRRFYSNILFCSARLATKVAFQSFAASDFELFLQKPESDQRNLLDRFASEAATETKLWAMVRNLSPVHLMQASNSFLEQFTSHSVSNDVVFKKYLAKENLDDTDYQLLLIAHGIPPVWSASLKRRVEKSHWSCAQLLDFLRLQNERPPLWIRLNNVAAREKVDQDLKSHDLLVHWQDDGRSAKVSGTFGVYQASSFRDGLFEVQDWASQQISIAVDARPGQKVWDACAGGGGKSVAIAADLKGKGALYASDIREHKLVEVRRRCLRAGFHNVRTLAWDGKQAPAFGKEIAIQSGFDAVLVDAPCTSSGTWRRNPDARLRIASEADRKSLWELQKQLLINALALVRPGGRLVYGTCSWCVEENEDVFLGVAEANTKLRVDGLKMTLHGSPQMDSDTMFSGTLLLANEP
ncbi:MAG: RsmB/NOP family class I SAM-dependent RNA methyltransferase [Silvanigrellaceae bacterium]